jgi:tRNA wybutosine-synthesizing protein 1
MYPKLPNLIKYLKLLKNTKSIFLVTNGQEPEMIVRLIRENSLPTQLYLSINASNKKMFYQINRPKYKDSWDRWLTTLSILSEMNTRTVLRITLIRNYNSDLNHIPEFVDLINKANPHFIEVKSYMHIGMSTNRLEHNNMLDVEEVREFTRELQKTLQGYNIMDESEISRIVVLQNHKRYTNRWIKEYFEPNIVQEQT